jgi:hypothetical protein
MDRTICPVNGIKIENMGEECDTCTYPSCQIVEDRMRHEKEESDTC